MLVLSSAVKLSSFNWPNTLIVETICIAAPRPSIAAWTLATFLAWFSYSAVFSSSSFISLSVSFSCWDSFEVSAISANFFLFRVALYNSSFWSSRVYAISSSILANSSANTTESWKASSWRLYSSRRYFCLVCIVVISSSSFVNTSRTCLALVFSSALNLLIASRLRCCSFTISLFSSSSLIACSVSFWSSFASSSWSTVMFLSMSWTVFLADLFFRSLCSCRVASFFCSTINSSLISWKDFNSSADKFLATSSSCFLNLTPSSINLFLISLWVLFNPGSSATDCLAALSTDVSSGCLVIASLALP